MTLSRRERHAKQKRNNPTRQSGALLAKWTMQILSADLYARPLTEATQLYKSPIIFYPVSRLTRKKLSSAEAILFICCVL